MIEFILIAFCLITVITLIMYIYIYDKKLAHI